MMEQGVRTGVAAAVLASLMLAGLMAVAGRAAAQVPAADGETILVHGRHGAAVVCRDGRAALTVGLDGAGSNGVETDPPLSTEAEQICPGATMVLMTIAARGEAIDDGRSPDDVDAVATRRRPVTWTDGGITARADPLDNFGQWQEDGETYAGHLEWDYHTGAVCIIAHGFDHCSAADVVRRAVENQSP